MWDVFQKLWVEGPLCKKVQGGTLFCIFLTDFLKNYLGGPVVYPIPPSLSHL